MLVDWGHCNLCIKWKLSPYFLPLHLRNMNFIKNYFHSGLFLVHATAHVPTQHSPQRKRNTWHVARINWYTLWNAHWHCSALNWRIEWKIDEKLWSQIYQFQSRPMSVQLKFISSHYVAFATVWVADCNFLCSRV